MSCMSSPDHHQRVASESRHESRGMQHEYSYRDDAPPLCRESCPVAAYGPRSRWRTILRKPRSYRFPEPLRYCGGRPPSRHGLMSCCSLYDLFEIERVAFSPHFKCNTLATASGMLDERTDKYSKDRRRWKGIEEGG